MPNDMRDRLVELIHSIDVMKFPTENFTEHLADYLIENGVILPPRKVGDTVYWILPYFNEWYVSEDTITEVGLKGFWVSEFPDADGMDDFTPWDEFGKTVFLTIEDAEKSLRERDGE